MIIIMCDGSSLGNPGPSSIGLIAWHRINGKSRFSKPTAKIHRHIGYATNNEAEWQAVIDAMEYIVKNKLCHEEIYIYTDSQLVYNQANLKWKIKHDHIQKLFDKWTDLLIHNRIENWNVVWVPRQLIELADKEANKK